MLSPAHALPSTAAVGSAAHSFALAYLSGVFPHAYLPSSSTPGLTFMPFSATLPGHAFVHPSVTSTGFGNIGKTTQTSFWAEFMPGNALGTQLSTQRTHVLAIHIFCLHYLFHNKCFYPCNMFVLLILAFLWQIFLPMQYVCFAYISFSATNVFTHAICLFWLHQLFQDCYVFLSTNIWQLSLVETKLLGSILFGSMTIGSFKVPLFQPIIYSINMPIKLFFRPNLD